MSLFGLNHIKQIEVSLLDWVVSLHRLLIFPMECHRVQFFLGLHFQKALSIISLLFNADDTQIHLPLKSNKHAALKSLLAGQDEV